MMKNKVLGAFIEGGLNGVALPLARIQGEQMEGDSSTRLGERVYATEQAFAVNAIDGTLVTDEVLAFADACMRLGDDSIAAATFSPSARQGLGSALRGLVSDGRAREVMDRVALGEFSRARDMLGPFDLYSLGLFFSKTGMPAPEPCDWSGAGKEEVVSLASKVAPAGLAQLGFPDNSWFGMNGSTLARLAPVEAAASYITPLRMAEATCDLKLRVAGLFRSLGLPATLFKPVAKALARECVKMFRQSSAWDWAAAVRAVRAIDETAVRKVLLRIFDVRGIQE